MLLESLGREPLHRGLSWVCRAELQPNLGLQSEGASGESPILECIVGKSRAGGAFLRFAVDLLDAASMPGLFALVPVLTIGARSKQTARVHMFVIRGTVVPFFTEAPCRAGRSPDSSDAIPGRLNSASVLYFLGRNLA